MTDPDDPDVFGRPTETAAAALAGPGDPDPDEIATTLELVAEDGVVSRDRVDEALAGLAKVVSTPETRVEVAERAVTEAREAAAGIDVDVDAVSHRLAGLDARLDAVADAVDALGDRLSDLLDDAGDPAALYEVAAGIRDLTDAANAAQRRADELRDDAEATARWLRDPEVRREEFDADVDAVADSVETLASTVDWLAGDADRSPDRVDIDDPGAGWADATVDARVTGLLVEDLRAELVDLRALADDGSSFDTHERRLTDLAARRDALVTRLDDLARPAWRETHGDRVAAATDRVDSFDPPVDWGAVQAALDGV